MPRPPVVSSPQGAPHSHASRDPAPRGHWFPTSALQVGGRDTRAHWAAAAAAVAPDGNSRLAALPSLLSSHYMMQPVSAEVRATPTPRHARSSSCSPLCAGGCDPTCARPQPLGVSGARDVAWRVGAAAGGAAHLDRAAALGPGDAALRSPAAGLGAPAQRSLRDRAHLLSAVLETARTVPMRRRDAGTPRAAPTFPIRCGYSST